MCLIVKILALSLLLISVFTAASEYPRMTNLYLNQSKTVHLKGDSETWFRLPKEHKYHEIELSIAADNGRIYYPIVKIYDRFKNPTRVLRTPIQIVQLGPYKEGIKVSIPFAPNDEFISISTAENLIGQSFTVERSGSTITPIILDGGTYYVPSVNVVNPIRYTFAKQGFAELLLPEDNKFSPEYQQEGWFFEMGVNFGGDTVANNPGGDDYKAGGGALLLMGYDWPSSWEDISWQASGGIRYQGAKVGEGENFGVIGRFAVDYDMGIFHTGFGLHLDMLGHTKDEYGHKTEFDSSIAPFLYIEWEMTPWFNLSASYMLAEFKDSNGKLYDGDQFGLGLKITNIDFGKF